MFYLVNKKIFKISCNFVIQSIFSPPVTLFCDSTFIHILIFLNEIGTLQESMKISVESVELKGNTVKHQQTEFMQCGHTSRILSVTKGSHFRNWDLTSGIL